MGTYIKMEFRTETIQYSKANRKESKNKETFLQEKLDVLDNEICHGNGLFNQSLLDEYGLTLGVKTYHLHE